MCWRAVVVGPAEVNSADQPSHHGLPVSSLSCILRLVIAANDVDIPSAMMLTAERSLESPVAAVGWFFCARPGRGHHDQMAQGVTCRCCRPLPHSSIPTNCRNLTQRHPSHEQTNQNTPSSRVLSVQPSFHQAQAVDLTTSSCLFIIQRHYVD